LVDCVPLSMPIRSVRIKSSRLNLPSGWRSDFPLSNFPRTPSLLRFPLTPPARTKPLSPTRRANQPLRRGEGPALSRGARGEREKRSPRGEGSSVLDGSRWARLLFPLPPGAPGEGQGGGNHRNSVSPAAKPQVSKAHYDDFIVMSPTVCVCVWKSPARIFSETPARTTRAPRRLPPPRARRGS